MIVWQTRKFNTTHIVKLGKFMLVFWFFTLSMYHVFYSDICKKKKMYWDLNAEESHSLFPHMWKCFMKFQKLLGAYVYVIMSTRLKPPLIVQRDSLKWSIKYNFLQDQEISRIWLKKFTLFSCLQLITFAKSLDPGQHRQNACPDLDSTGPDLDPKYLTPWLWCSWKKIEKVNFEKKISRWKQMHEKSPSMQIINRLLILRQKHVFIDFSRCYSDFSRWFTIANDRLLHEMLPVPSTSCDLSTCKVWNCYSQPLR